MTVDERRPVNRMSPENQNRSTGAPRRPAPQGARPQGARPQGARPQGARPQGARPQGARPQGARPQGSRPSSDARYRDEEPRRPRQERPNRPQGKRRPDGKKKSGAGKIVLLIVEILVLAGMGVFLYFVLTATKTGKVELPEEDIIINEELKAKLETTSSNTGDAGGDSETASLMSGYRNIALFGVDSREGALTKNTRSDTIIIASISEETGEVKLCSVYRDTYLNLSNDSYNKCNAAYAKGGPTQAINMLNMNLDMNITDFVTIGFEGLTDVIDALGGVEVNVLDSEIVHLNNYQISMVGKTSDGETFTADAGTDYIPVKSAGRQVLNGLQATAYCRIRYVGNDFQRAERQRTVINAILEKAKANPSKLPAVAESLFDEVYTSLDLSEIIDILTDITKYSIVDQAGFPMDEKVGVANIGAKGSCVIPLDLYDNVVWLHKFLFNDASYEPSSSVKTYSDKVKEDTSPYL